MKIMINDVCSIGALDEQILRFEVNGNKFSAFSHPSSLVSGDEIDAKFQTLGCKGVLASSAPPHLTQKKDSLEHCFSGQIINREIPLISIFSIELALDCSLPGDLKDGDYIEGCCNRIDWF